MEKNPFRNELAENTFHNKYAGSSNETWWERALTIVDYICGSAGGSTHPLMSKEDRDQLARYIFEFKFLPGGRYIYYAGRQAKFYNNCYLLRAETDTREEWAALAQRSTSCLMTGGGIGVDYSALRPKGRTLKRTGGIASGPIPLMYSINEIGRNVMQGGSRRSAIYASLNWQHEDVEDFLQVKNWYNQPVGDTTLGHLKEDDFNFPAPLDMTNISLNYDDEWLESNNREKDSTFIENCRQALSTGEPGFSFNFGDQEFETLRNACVPGDTPILTDEGYVEIEDVIGIEVPVWNGQTFSKVTPFSTGVNQLVRVNLSDGSYLDCTPYHEFILAGNIRCTADDLKEGDRLEKFPMPTVEAGHNYDVDPYSQGFYAGDGNTGLTHSWLYHTKYECEDRLCGIVTEEDIMTGRKTWKHGPMFDKRWVPIRGTKSYCLEWLAGLVDSDGTATKDKNGNGIQIASIDKNFLLNLKLMLSRLGVRAKVCKAKDEGSYFMPDGRGGLTAYSCNKVWRILIGNTDTHWLMENGLNTSRVYLHSNPPQRDARRFVTVESIENRGAGKTYCFTEPLANRGTFNGIVTGQCTEVTSEDDSDVCNLGSVNVGAIDDIEEFKDVVRLASKFLVCGTMRAELPYDKVYEVREINRRLGLGLMGIHEWLLKRNQPYEVTDELHKWLAVYQKESEKSANEHCDRFFINRPVAYRAIAPTGTIGILAGTTTGIEPLFATAYKRRYLKDGDRWKYMYVVDSIADELISRYDVDPNSIDTAQSLASEPERRIKFQADVQDYVDMGISSTINLPQWGTEWNNENGVEKFAETLSQYAPRLRGMTVYPDGSRGGQPITQVDYNEAKERKGVVYEENDECKSGVCGI